MFDPNKKCPLLNKKCIKHDCQWFLALQGTNPNTGHPVDEWGCAMAFLPVLMIENSMMQRQTGAAVESFRNETVESSRLLVDAMQRKQLTNGKG